MKTIRFFIEKLSVFGGETSIIFEEACFRNAFVLSHRNVFDYMCFAVMFHKCG